ncbi:phosphate acetyltransferase [Adlercreutzia sp. R7]|uniref:Phosphate acetyltransferase n=1 Tax=Adlercreutzia wanghongyangiae TaxID=3111451 RepID=A0ABU6IHG0_9ACTN|nr:phosphate acetyltransferase [Adlercreutzia sp. R7]
MSAFLETMIARAKADKQTIVLPEGNDERTLAAAEQIHADNLADLIILGNPDAIAAAGYQLEGARIIDPLTSELREPYAEKLAELRASKGMTVDEARALMDNELYFGMMMVKEGEAAGLVSGACHSTGDVLRPALQILKTAPGAQMVSSFFIMNVPDCDLGHNGTFLFSDCGLEVQPDADRLAQIALNADAAWHSLIDDAEPVIAMLSHSSYGSAKNDDAGKVVAATAKVKELAPELAVDGELQLDAAIVPEIGAAKAPDSPVAGRANVLVFPDIDAGNIGYKLVQRLAKAEAYGPILQGIAAPVNDLSRGCSADDIVGVVAITAVQAQGK